MKTHKVTVAITGPTGSGKTIVVNALIAFCASHKGCTVHAGSNQDHFDLEMTLNGRTALKEGTK